jgi:hypothetical protein
VGTIGGGVGVGEIVIGGEKGTGVKGFPERFE